MPPFDPLTESAKTEAILFQIATQLALQGTTQLLYSNCVGVQLERDGRGGVEGNHRLKTRETDYLHQFLQSQVLASRRVQAVLNIDKKECINYLCTYDLYRPVYHVLEACITRVSGRGVGPGNLEFLGPVKWHQAHLLILRRLLLAVHL